MKITIAICTLNRSRLLAQTLESLQQTHRAGLSAWEILVVDNGSTDRTSQVLDSAARDLPIQVLKQPIPGHSRCRNLAVQHATGELIIWIDDDVIVSENWLEAYVRAAKSFPQAGFFGGPIIPVFEAEQPVWLRETWLKCRAAFAAREQGDQELTIPPGLLPFGANFAVRSDLQKKFLFDVQLGRKGRGTLGEDEIDLLQRLMAAGATGVWLPHASLQHVMPAERATPEYVARYFVGQGVANVIKNRPTFNSRWHAFRVALHNRLCYWAKRNRTVPDEWVSHLIRSSIAWGEFIGWRRGSQRFAKSQSVAGDSER